jgi:hypothetical protein
MLLFYYIAGILNELPRNVRDKAILAGGAIRAFYDRTPVKDYDLFFRSFGDFLVTLIAVLRAGWRLEKWAGRTFYMRAPSGKLFNLVGFNFGTPEWQVKRFDLSCCSFAAYFDEDNLEYRMTQLGCARDDAEKKRLWARHPTSQKRLAHYRDDYGYADCPHAETRPVYHRLYGDRVYDAGLDPLRDDDDNTED